jgi:hypothetical protein
MKLLWGGGLFWGFPILAFLEWQKGELPGRWVFNVAFMCVALGAATINRKGSQ